MKKVLSLLLLVVTIGFASFSGPMYDEDTEYSSWEEASVDIIDEMDSMGMIDWDWGSFYYDNSCNLRKYIKRTAYLDMYSVCTSGEVEGGPFNIIVRIYGNDKISSLMSKIKNGQKQFQFPTLLSVDENYVFYIKY